MQEILFPYGKEKISQSFGHELVAVLTSEIEEFEPEYSESERSNDVLISKIIADNG